MKDRFSARSLVMLSIVLAAGTFVPSALPAADDGYIPIYLPQLVISRISAPIVIDGDVGDAGWAGVAKAKNFAEHNPGNQTKPAVDTEVLIGYDDKNLYVGWICYDDPKEVRTYRCERDNIFSGDYVILCIDPYGDATLAYEIASNPYGIPGDLLFSQAYGEDSSYDMIFQSAGKVTDFGWVVEMAIPFESMRFPNRPEQTWKMDFWRNRPRESRYQYSWAAYNRDENCWPCQWGTVSGITGVKPGAGFELLPAVTAHQSGSLGDNNRFDNGDVMGQFSLGAKYNVSSELTAEATVNPDFSQIEADEAQIDVNTTFALSYPEKRPFFQEGSDLFNTYFNAVYTRSINDPSVAGKMTWRNGSNSVAFLTGRDEHTMIILPFEERSRFVENGKSYSNIMRMKHDFGNATHIGLLATDRRYDGGGAGSLVGIDGQVRLSKSNTARAQFLTTHTEEVDNLSLVADSAFNASRFDGGNHTSGLDGESFWGHAFLGNLERSTGKYWANLQYLEKSPTYRADNGFQPSNNERSVYIETGGILRFEKSKVLESVQSFVALDRKWNFDGVQKDEWIQVSNEVRFRAGQTGIHSNYLASNELFRGIHFNGIWGLHTCFNTQPNGSLQLGANYNYGHRIARWALSMGKETSWGAWTDVKLTGRVRLYGEFTRIQSDAVDSGERLFSQEILWSRLSVQMTRELSLRLVAQYSDQWNFDPLISYRINSFTVFYAGSTHTYRDLSLAEDGREGWTLTDRQFFVKLQYLLRI